jgi:uncharacterized secreted repeat protein (TIGR03808 family)
VFASREKPLPHPDRRTFLLSAAAGMIASPVMLAPRAIAAPLSAIGVDAAQFGVRPGATTDQTPALQRALDQTAATRVPLVLAPGVYRAGNLKLPAGAQFVGVRGATRLVFSGGASLLSATQADSVTLSGLVLDGAGLALARGRGLVSLANGRGLKINDCEITRAGGTALLLEQMDGEVTGNLITDAANIGVHSFNARGLTVSGNIVRRAGNGGIWIWTSDKRDDGTLVADNQIEDIQARDGGSGQNGNAVNVFRAANVVVRGNRIRNAAFSAVRGNAASNIQITGNSCGGFGEVAIYSEFDFEGAVIANNTIDGAAIGVSVTNFDKGGRLAVVQGNLIRNLTRNPPDGTEANRGHGAGISVQADTAVTGNVIENAPSVGIEAGWGPYLRDVTITGNVVRQAGYGITVSVVSGAGAAVIANNLIAGAKRGAIVGMEWNKPVTGDLIAGTSQYPLLTINGNKAR